MTFKLDISGLMAGIQKDVQRHAGNALVSANDPSDTVIEQTFLAKFRDAGMLTIPAFLLSVLNNAVETHSIVNGLRGDPGVDADDWDADLDTRIEEELTGLVDIIGQDGLGVIMSDTRLHEDKRPAELAHEIAKLVCTKLTSAPLKDEVLRYFDLTAFKANLKSFRREDVSATGRERALTILETIQGFFSDTNYLRQEFESVCDSDDILASAAATRLGVAVPTDLIDACRAWALVAPKGAWIDEAIAKVLGEPYEAKKAPSGRKGRGKKADEQEAAPPAPEPVPEPLQAGDADAAELASLLGEDAPVYTAAADPAPAAAPLAPPAEQVTADAQAVLAFLLDHTKATDRELATSLGVSRATVGNMKKGKSKIDDAQAATILAALDAHKQALASL